MSRLLLILFIAVGAQGLSAQTSIDSAQVVFQEANRFYQSGDFAKAVEKYESLIGQGITSAEIHFNLGNAYYRIGKLGPAILNYERANRLEPGDDDIDHNLRLANLRIVDRIESVPELFVVSWLRTLAGITPLSTTLFLFVLSWSLFFLSLAAVNVIARRRIRQTARWAILASLIVFVLSGILAGLQIIESGTRNDAVVLSSVVTAKNSPDEQSTDAFVIHEGLKVTLGARIDDWVRITLADGKVGWIHSKELATI